VEAAVFDGTKPIEPYLGNPDYNFDYDMADRAIEWVRNQKAVAPTSRSPLLPPGATHSPHQPKKEWIAKYKGKFDQAGTSCVGDAGAPEEGGSGAGRHEAHRAQPRDTRMGLPQRRTEAALCYMMEIYAGTSPDGLQRRRVLDAIEQLGQMDNTLVIYICGDNGQRRGMLQGLAQRDSHDKHDPEDYRTS